MLLRCRLLTRPLYSFEDCDPGLEEIPLLKINAPTPISIKPETAAREELSSDATERLCLCLKDSNSSDSLLLVWWHVVRCQHAVQKQSKLKSEPCKSRSMQYNADDAWISPWPNFSALQNRLGKAWKSTAKMHIAVQRRVVPRTDVI